MNNNLTIHSTTEDTTVNIFVNGELASFDYEDLKTYHQGDSWFGCTVGFRAMQVAARELSNQSVWSRENLSVVNGHPGSGVKDAIELITATISSKHYQLLDNINDQGCYRNMKFEWWVTNKHKTIHIKLHSNIIPEKFFILLDRINSNEERTTDHDEFDQIKIKLSNKLWSQSLDASFDFNHSSALSVNDSTYSKETK